MSGKATIYDLERMCKAFRKDFCKDCPLYSAGSKKGIACGTFVRYCADKANEIILKWCKEHPVKTRQSEFLEMFPNVELVDDGVINICPNTIDVKYGANCRKLTCKECRKNYWLTEVEENE